MNINTYTDKFFHIEESLKLFEDETNGVLWWDAVRHEIYYFVYFRLEKIDSPSNSNISFSGRIYSFLIRKAKKYMLWLRAHLFRYDAIVFSTPRALKNGKRYDQSLHDILQICPGKKLIINTFPYYYHQAISNNIDPKLRCPAVIDRLWQMLNEDIETDIGLEELKNSILIHTSQYLRAKDSYRSLFKRVRPKYVIMSQNGIQKSMFYAAEKLDIPLIEMQHGLINYGHPGYSYSRKINYDSLRTFPSYFLCFSSYWCGVSHYPVAHKFPIGNDEYHVKPDPDFPADGSIVFISANFYHTVLCSWLKVAAQRLPQKKFIYKLHPNQIHDLATVRADLASFTNIEVIGLSKNIREIMSVSAVIVVIQSTIAHEALQMGRRVCVIPEMDYQVHTDLFELPNVHVTYTHEQMINAIELPMSPTPPPIFFDRFDREGAKNLMNAIFNGNSNLGPAFKKGSSAHTVS